MVLYAAMQTNTITEDSGFNNKRTRHHHVASARYTVGQPAFSLPSPVTSLPRHRR